MIKRIFISFVIGAGLLACSSVREVSYESELINIQGEEQAMNGIDSLIAPYHDSLTDEMDIVIAHTSYSLEKNRPNGNLNNWAADALQDRFMDSLDAETLSLLNIGGLRNTINQGDVTIGDIFKVMPFDNEVVIVKMPLETLTELASYIVNSGGEPLSGAVLRYGGIMFNNGTPKDHYYIITSDYLMNGGDNMTFFEKRIDFHYAGMLLRDVFIEAAKDQSELEINDDLRIFLNE